MDKGASRALSGFLDLKYFSITSAAWMQFNPQSGCSTSQLLPYPFLKPDWVSSKQVSEYFFNFSFSFFV